jgi:hypothetical protein
MNNEMFDGIQERLARQQERLRKENTLHGWSNCRFLAESGDRRCGAIPLYGGYCERHLLEYPYPRLVDNPRDRWRDSSIIASEASNVMILLQWLIRRNDLSDARWLVNEKADSIERSLRSQRRLATEALEMFNLWYEAISIQELQFRIYLVLQPLHDIAYEGSYGHTCVNIR